MAWLHWVVVETWELPTQQLQNKMRHWKNTGPVVRERPAIMNTKCGIFRLPLRAVFTDIPASVAFRDL